MKAISDIFVVLMAYSKQYEIPTPLLPRFFVCSNRPPEDSYLYGKGIRGTGTNLRDFLSGIEDWL